MSRGTLKIIAALIVITAVGAVLYALLRAILVVPDTAEVPVIETPPAEETPPTEPRVATIGTSVLGRPITTHTFGSGGTDLLFVGGIHGGYEWNSVLLAYEFIDYLTEDPSRVPENLTVHIVPAANPDGVYRVIGVEGRFTLDDVPADEGPAGNGRFNANGVDLNRNFDCKWQPESTWRGNPVSAGTGAFSEPEAQAIRDLVFEHEPIAAVFWHSQSNAVYASECTEGILPATRTLMNTYANAAGYPAVDSFDFYEITGDVEGWLASIGIPAITVELATHETLEWERNRAGFDALLAHYGSSTPAQ